PGKFRGPKPVDDRFEAVVPARRSAWPRAQPAERQCNFIHHDQQIGRGDVVVTRQRGDRIAAAVHERQRLGDEQRLGAVLLRDERIGHLRGGQRQREAVPPRDLVDDHEPHVVPRLAILATRISQTNNELHGVRRILQDPPYFFGASFFGASSSLSVLPFLMTSGSVPAAATGAAAASAAGATTSSAFGITTCTSIVSPSVTAFHFGSTARSRTRIDW